MSAIKAAQAALKPQLQAIPPVASREMAAALQNGIDKGYGPWNWRGDPVKLSVYLGAMKRHIDAIVDGEDHASDSGVHHLGHVMASCAIILDAEMCGTLIDDRILPPSKVSLGDG